MAICLAVNQLLFHDKTVQAAEPAGSSQLPDDRAAALHQRVNSTLDLSASSIQELAVRSTDASHISTTLSVEGQPWTLDLEKHSIRSPDFQVLVDVDGRGTLVPVEPPPVQTYRGTVREMPNTEVRGSFIDGQLTAVIYTPTGKYGVQPLDGIGVASDANQYVVYRDQDWKNSEGYACGTTDAHRVAPLHGTDGGGSEASFSGLFVKLTDLGLDADFDFFVKNGSSVAATVADMENVINTMEPIYEVPAIKITYEITVCIVRTAAGTYFSSVSEDLLFEFRAVWRTLPESDIRRDTAHLFTGKNLNGGIIGVAFVGVVCQSPGSFAYGLSESRFSSNFSRRVGLTAHEIAHNWNAPHCDADPTCNIMCSGLGGCSGNITSFTSLTAGRINTFKNSRTCLSNLGSPLSVPFLETFESGTLDPQEWSYNQGGDVDPSALNEPSGTLSLNLDSTGSRLFQDDEIRSNFMLLENLLSLALSYFTQHRGVESGEELVVEYWNDELRWVEINRITSDGVDQSEFDFHVNVLPDDAFHDEFRIRFRTEGDETNDDWFIDDVQIAIADCDGNSIADACDVDCGLPGGFCDVPGCAGGADCNGNLVLDECDLTAGTSQDCQPNGIPDECDILSGNSDDCVGPPTDCFTVHAESGCNSPTVEACVCGGDSFCCAVTWDSSCVTLAELCSNCEPGIAGNGIPDECEVSCFGDEDCVDGDPCTSDICAAPGVCQHPPNFDPTLFCCDSGTGNLTSLEDGVACTVGTCNPDGTVTQSVAPDGAQPDCGAGDPCTSGGCVNGSCELSLRAYGDLNHDGSIDLFDLFCVLSGFSSQFDDCTFDDVDIEPCQGDGDIDLFDLFAVLNAFSGIDPCCP